MTSAVLDRDLVITGNPVISLPIRADRPDVNVFAYLEDRGPDQQVTVITEGRLKASLRALAQPPFKVPGTPWHRAYAADVQPLVAAATATLEFDLLPTSYRLPKGHRLQVTVMGADYRERGRDPKLEGAVIRVLSSASGQAWLDLPVLPPADAPAAAGQSR